jgi:lipoyl(octanoyl) transferase
LILWCDGGHGAAENMRRDAALFSSCAPGREAVLRVYRFTPAGITLGLSQRPERELDLEACRTDGIEWAIRPTGGRAIFHDEEWTYGLAAAIGDPAWGGRLHEAYARTSQLLVQALQRLGIPARLTPGSRRTELDRLPLDAPAAPCFASTARHEIVLGDGKLVGSAQRRGALALLQQGSILLGSSHRRLADYLAAGAPLRARAREQLARAAAMAGPPWQSGDLDRFAGALADVLGRGARRIDGPDGQFLLKASRTGYAAPDSTGTHREHPEKEMRP